MKAKHIKNKLSTLKYNAIKLRAQHQLPFMLCYYITQLNENSDVSWIEYLMALSEHMLRVKGYYIRYPEIEQQFDEEIKAEFNRRFSQ